MRITSQMLSMSAKKAGLSTHNTSLLNYINNNQATSASSIFNALKNTKTSSTVDTRSKRGYQKIERTADKLTQSAAILKSSNKNNVFAKAKESGDNKQILENIENLFDNYNNTIKMLKNTSGTMNDFYRQMLTDAPEDVEESLKNIGITFAKDGTANIDKDKLKAADTDTLENLFGSKSKFMNKLTFLSERISDSAEANVRSLNNSYGANGNLYNSNSGSKYNFWG